MARRLQAATEGVVEMDSRLERLTNQMDELEESRIAILPEANKRLMVYVPPGPFTMGGRDEDSPRNEQPAHTVHLTGYYIGKMPVTNQEYREFVQCTGYRAPIHWQRGTFPTGMGKHPVTNVTWRDACAYAAWRGAKLPTEAEWEKAARGTDERPYPWGGRFTEGERCNASGLIGTTTPVDEFPEGRSFYEAWDMAGNVYEWCADHYDEEYYHDSPATNPPGPEGGQEGTIRGGSYQETRAALRTTHRAGPPKASPAIRSDSAWQCPQLRRSLRSLSRCLRLRPRSLRRPLQATRPRQVPLEFYPTPLLLARREMTKEIVGWAEEPNVPGIVPRPMFIQRWGRWSFHGRCAEQAQ